MVIAEIPLWVVHSNNEESTTTPPSNDSDTAATTALNAIQSYYLTSSNELKSSTTNIGSTTTVTTTKKKFKKCAIYSIDTYHDLFVTGGGDGTIRIWNCHALFCNTTNSNTKDNNSKVTETNGDGNNNNHHHHQNSNSNKESRAIIKGAHYDEVTGAYVSSEGSDGGGDGDDYEDHNDIEEEEEEEDDEEEEENDDFVANANGRTALELPTQRATTTQSTIGTSNTIHDLNANVRSKHHSNITKISSPVKNTESSQSTNTANFMNHTTTQASSTSASSNIGTKQKQKHSPITNKLLCTVAAHTGSSVLCVRFSYSGQYIASAGDDGCVCIYTKQQQQFNLNTTTTTVNSNTGTNYDNWARIKLCRGHELDVVDLAWSPSITDDYLVSCSLDSNAPIIVWKLQLSSNQQKNNSIICHPYKILGKNIHTSTVKGVAFDPAGSYLASSGDDPAICIWRTHDDWGLIKRIDHTSGIFRTWKQQNHHHHPNSNNDTAADDPNYYEDDVQALSNQSLFRRISWSTDGAFLCSTNSVVKNKHVASTISREKWYVSGSGSSSNTNSNPTTGTAANLVGHKQPIVVCRHASQLLHTRKNMDVDQNGQVVPEYATLLALGDRRGFVTVWSTRKSRPIFKVQCSESHCTVTDLSWGRIQDTSKVNNPPDDIALTLFVSLLDGQVVVFRFSIPEELGYVLSDIDKSRVFQLRYGIDINGDDNDDLDVSFGRRFGTAVRGPTLIESALQMSYENSRKMQVDVDDHDVNVAMNDDDTNDNADHSSQQQQQQESRSLGGKKRIRPVLVQTIGGPPPNKQQKTGTATTTTQQQKSSATTTNPLQNAMTVAERAITAAEGTNIFIRKDNVTTGSSIIDISQNEVVDNRQRTGRIIDYNNRPVNSSFIPSLPYSINRVYSTELPTTKDSNVLLQDDQTGTVVTVDCVNSTKVPLGSKSGSMSCIDVTISSGGRVTWKDQIVGTSCTSLSASRMLFAIGTTDGTIQMYGTSPTLGWSCGTSFRSHPPLILGAPIIFLQLCDNERDGQLTNTKAGSVDLLIVTADGTFGVWTVIPKLQLQYKGTITPIMAHMSHSADDTCGLPKLSRVQITETGHLLVILSFESPSNGANRNGGTLPTSQSNSVHSTTGPGGSIQAFMYDRNCELWMRVSDSRFVISDFYTAIPTSITAKTPLPNGILNKIDDAIRLGSIQSSLKAGHRNQMANPHVGDIYEHSEYEFSSFIVSRSHCEDRLACAIVMNSQSEFKEWFRNYVRLLVLKDEHSQLRLLVDMMLQKHEGTATLASIEHQGWWWLSYGSKVMGEDRVSLVKELVIPEVSRSRKLQRLTNEISIELENMQ